MSKIPRTNIAPTLTSPVLDATLACYSCTGTISSAIQFFDKGDYIIICGRATISDFVRTGTNPGFNVTLPSGITVKKYLNVVTGGNVINNSANIAESPIVRANVDSSVITLCTTETYTNISSGTFAMHIPPICIAVNRS